MDSVDSLDIVNGHPGLESRWTGQCPLSPWTDWTLSMVKNTMHLVKKIKVKGASLEIYTHISFK